MHLKTASESKHFECDFDGKIFKSKAKIRGHMAYHRQKIKCDLCQIEVLPMQQHIVNFHTTERKFQCKIFKNCFKSKNATRSSIVKLALSYIQLKDV